MLQSYSDFTKKKKNLRDHKSKNHSMIPFKYEKKIIEKMNYY